MCYCGSFDAEEVVQNAMDILKVREAPELFAQLAQLLLNELVPAPRADVQSCHPQPENLVHGISPEFLGWSLRPLRYLAAAGAQEELGGKEGTVNVYQL